MFMKSLLILGCAFVAPIVWASEPTRGGVIPYFVDGGGSWTTALSITCLDQAGCQYSATFIGSNGQRVSIAMRVTTGTSMRNISDSVISVVTQFGVTTLMETLGQSSAIVSGGVDVQSPSLITGHSIFRQRVAGRSDYEATVNMESRDFTRSFGVPFDNRAGFATGLALLNLTNDAPANITVQGVDFANNILFQGSISLAALNSTAFDLAGRFPESAGRAGVVIFASPVFISGSGFRFNSSGPFTTLPIFSIR